MIRFIKDRIYRSLLASFIYVFRHRNDDCEKSLWVFDHEDLRYQRLVGSSQPVGVRVLAFSDPQSVTINAIANSLPRTSSRDNSSSYTKDDGNVKLLISSLYGKRVRRTARLDHKKVAPDPLFPANNAPFSMSVYLVVDVPQFGYSVTEQKQIVDALTLWLTTTSGSNVTRLLGGES